MSVEKEMFDKVSQALEAQLGFNQEAAKNLKLLSENCTILEKHLNEVQNNLIVASKAIIDLQKRVEELESK